MIKAVLFDFGGVLSEAGKRGSIRRIFGEVYGLDLDVATIDDIVRKMWRGQISDEEFLAEINRRYPHTPPVTPDEFRAAMDEFTRSELVYALAAELRAKGIKTGILSNIFGLGVKPLRAGGFYDGFDPVLLSCEVGYAKPEKAFYDLAVERLGVHPEEILFIDDQEICLEPARNMGMHTLLAQSPDQIVADTKRIISEQNKS